MPTSQRYMPSCRFSYKTDANPVVFVYLTVIQPKAD
jgi:hypothetical protein